METANFLEHEYYGGSRTFTWLADLSGLSIDLINFLICQVIALFLASLFRSVLHPSKVSSTVRHVVALVLGLCFGYFCFGPQAIHIAGLPTVCYVVIRTQNPQVVQRYVMLVAMTYLLTIHLMRQIYDNGSDCLDITGPLMIITQKVTSLAYSIHDGFVRSTKELTKAQQYHAVRKMPSTLEYYSFVLNFHGLLAGPAIFYKDYIEFIEGSNLLKSPAMNVDNIKSPVIVEPSPVKAVIKKVVGSLICAFIFIKFSKLYPIKNLKDEDFISNSSSWYCLWYTMMSTTFTRFKYYHAWLLADAICNNSGLGFTGYDKDGNANWDLISNINVLGFEFATNMRDAINNWNCGTNRWLRTVVYERVPKKYGTVLTFALSAVWHGFYPGYYLTFATGALMVTSARVARRMFRHRFQRTQFTRMFYDILTCLTTRIVMGYTTFPFVMLEFMASIRLYLNFYLCLHIVALITICILPKFIKDEKRMNLVAIPVQETLRTDCADAVSAPNGRNLKKLPTNKQNSLINILAVNAASYVNTDLNNDFIENNYESLKQSQQQKQQQQQQQKQQQQQQKHEHQQKRTSLTSELNNIASDARDAVSVKHDQCEMDQLSSKLKEKIEAETKNIEEFIDKTVTETVSGIVCFKNDLMRDCEFPHTLRKRNTANLTTQVNDVAVNAACLKPQCDENAPFLKKEIEVINAVVQQANVLPAVLSNGHAK
ncbi:lysophospholipid acyltransferase 1 [Glossina fuscipes]|uniref:Lysophospholipid acyltransferase 1 n=1 Tax=Glossina fuscipes TaxID=7396 RepID=A0A9C5Z2U2_9MUSC|nr:lysophospholipid acyltransferase 1 [Glossina fuscipes]KAI9582424.1 hypothetical protein GQX74_009811 [Glossina fuscipes]